MNGREICSGSGSGRDETCGSVGGSQGENIAADTCKCGRELYPGPSEANRRIGEGVGRRERFERTSRSGWCGGARIGAAERDGVGTQLAGMEKGGSGEAIASCAGNKGERGERSERSGAGGNLAWGSAGKERCDCADG